MAKTSRPCSLALLAVMSEPLFSPASTTSTPWLMPEIILFLIGKVVREADESGVNSLIRAPVSLIRRRSGSLSRR